MKKLIVTVILLAVWGYGAEKVCDLNALQKLVGRKVALRQELAREQSEWAKAKVVLERENSLLEKALLQTKAEIAAERTRHSDGAADFARKSAATKRLQKQIDGLRKPVKDAEKAVAAVLPKVPASLCGDELKYFGTATNANPTAEEKLRHVLDALSAIEQIEYESHAVKEMLEINGQRRAMDVIYLGLARGYAVSPDNSVAAVGVASAAGWKWQVEPGIEKDTRRLFEVKSGQAPPRTVELPFGSNFREVAP